MSLLGDNTMLINVIKALAIHSA